MAPSALATPPEELSSFATKNIEVKSSTDNEMECLLHEMSAGPNALSGIPKFNSHQEHRQDIVLHMAAIFRLWARSGFTEGTSGHISVRDPEHENCIWMNPIGKHFGLLTAGDMLCLQIDSGRIVGGNRTRPYNLPGYYIHSEIHKARPDVHAICHAHTTSGRAWCAFGRPLDMIHQDICTLHEHIAVDTEYGGLVTATEEGQRIASILGPSHKAALLLNHGLLTVGTTVDEASFLFGLLDRSCEIQLKVEAACAGNSELKKTLVEKAVAEQNFRMAGEKNWLYEDAQPDIEYEIEMAGERIKSGLDDIAVDRL